MAPVLAAPAVAQDAVVLEPISRWNIDYGEASCALRRTFAADATNAELEILQEAPGPYFRVTVTSGTLGLVDSKARVRFEPDNRRQVPEFLEPKRLDGRTSIAFTDSLQENAMGSQRPYIDWSDERRQRRELEITSLSIEDGFDRNIALAVGEMHEPMEALRACMSDLYASWGVDLEVHETLSSPVRGQNVAPLTRQVARLVPRAFFASASDLPAVVRTIVGPDGRVKRCSVHFAEWDEPLSDQICDVVAREARFDPARDRRGRAITSYQAIFIER